MKKEDFEYKKLNRHTNNLKKAENLSTLLIIGSIIIIILSLVYSFEKSEEYKDRYYVYTDGTIKRIAENKNLSELLAKNILTNLLENHQRNVVKKFKESASYIVANSQAYLFFTEMLNKNYVKRTISEGMVRTFTIDSIKTKKIEKNKGGYIHYIYGKNERENSFGKTILQVMATIETQKASRLNITEKSGKTNNYQYLIYGINIDSQILSEEKFK